MHGGTREGLGQCKRPPRALITTPTNNNTTMTLEELRRRLDAVKVEQKDYSELSVLELLIELYGLKYKLTEELATAGMDEELEAWLYDGHIDVDAVTDELMEHIDVLEAMKRVCEEILRAVCDKEFDD